MEGTLYEEVSSASYSENDISNSLKNGILYLEDPVDHVGDRQPPSAVCDGVALTALCFAPQTWTPHYFVLTSNKIYYSEETSRYQTADEEEDDEVKEVEAVRVVAKATVFWKRRLRVLWLLRSATTTSSTAQSAGSTGSWVEVATAVRWPRSSCRSTAREGPKTEPSWCGRVRLL